MTLSTPPQLSAIQSATAELNFTMSCHADTGSLLRTLARSKPAGRFLEIGTGTGESACWLLDGMDVQSRLISIDNDSQALAVATQHLGHDKRVVFHCMDGEDYIQNCVAKGSTFDFVFADSWPGKFYRLEETLSLVNVGGIYFVDDLHPQPNWPSDHPPKVEAFINTILVRDDLLVTQLEWSIGLILAVKK